MTAWPDMRLPSGVSVRQAAGRCPRRTPPCYCSSSLFFWLHFFGNLPTLFGASRRRYSTSARGIASCDSVATCMRHYVTSHPDPRYAGHIGGVARAHFELPALCQPPNPALGRPYRHATRLGELGGGRGPVSLDDRRDEVADLVAARPGHGPRHRHARAEHGVGLTMSAI